MYKRVINPFGDDNQVKRIRDNAFIPFVNDNADYQEYLKWVAEGNTPESADE